MEKSFLLILFYSASGSVKNLAHAIADGAEEQNLNVKLRTVPKISAQNKKMILKFQNLVKYIAQKKI